MPPFDPEARRGRYAPSPSGPLHLGNLRTALLSWLQAKLAGGRLILRMEDLDQPRVQPGCDETILEELRWLGLDWDEGPPDDTPPGPYVQSQRGHIYEAALQHLDKKGLVYRCYCSRKDIALAVSAPHGHDGLPPYPGTCSNLGPDEEKALIRKKPDRIPAWRFRVPKDAIKLEDRIFGPLTQNLKQIIGDFILKRADGLFAYQLAVVVDDGLMGITDVVRGADLLDSAPRQVALFQALDLKAPNFWHVPLAHNQTGQRLAKRDGALGLEPLRKLGLKPGRVIGYLASSLGWAAPGESLSAEELLQRMTLEQFRDSLKKHGFDRHSILDPEAIRNT